MKPKQHGRKWRVTRRENGKVTPHTFNSEAEAWHFISLLSLDKKEEPATPVPADQAQLIEQYLATSLANKRQLTINNVRSIITKVSASIGLLGLTNPKIFDYLKKYKSSTAAGILKWIRNFELWYTSFIDREYKSKIDFRLIKRGITKQDKREKPYLSDDDFTKLIDYVPSYYKTIYRIMACSGIRVRELTRLDLSDFNRRDWTITIPATKSKSGKERSFVVPDEIRGDFTKIINKEDGPLITRNGKRLSPNGLSNGFADHCAKAGLGKRNIHLLRAYAIKVILAASSGDYQAVRCICGWSSDEMQKYLDDFRGKKEEIAHYTSFKPRKNDGGRMVELLVDGLKTIMTTEGIDAKQLAIKSGVPYAWLYRFLESGNEDVSNLVRVVEAMDYFLNLDPVKMKDITMG